MRFRLRTLLIVLALGPPVVGCANRVAIPPLPVPPRPSLIGSWKAKQEDSTLTFKFFANLDLHVCNDSGGLVRKLSYRWTSDRTIELAINDPDYKLSGILVIVEPGQDEDHLVLHMPAMDGVGGLRPASESDAHQRTRVIIERAH